MLHRQKARKFYDSLNNVGDSFTVAFDMMENLVLPKSPIRQGSFYIFGVVCHLGVNQPQRKENIHLHYLMMSLPNVQSCYGQNKNISLLSLLFSLKVLPKLSSSNAQDATSLAFFGLLCASGYLSEDSHSSHKKSPRLPSDIRVSTDYLHMKIAIRKSKTDPFRNGCTIIVWATHTAVCPIQGMEWFLSRHLHLNGPLFRFANGSNLTRQRLSQYLQGALPNMNLNTHSFRIGGASATARMGIPDSTIQEPTFGYPIQLSNTHVSKWLTVHT